MNYRRYIRTFKNWPYVFFNVFRKKFNFSVVYRDGRKVVALTQAHLYFLSFDPKDLQYDEINDVLSFDFEGRLVRMKGALNNGDVGSIFGQLCYDVNVIGKTVVDIGANIGDSSIFFALKGASRIIAIEPAYVNYLILKENISLNDLDSTIVPVNKGVSAENGIIKLSPHSSGAMFKTLKNEPPDGIDVQLISMKEVINDYNPQIIKIDCEGCEYNIFDNISIDYLQKIEIILGEYHHKGFYAINEKLQSAGFVTNFDQRKSTGLFVALKKNISIDSKI